MIEIPFEPRHPRFLKQVLDALNVGFGQATKACPQSRVKIENEGFLRLAPCVSNSRLAVRAGVDDDLEGLERTSFLLFLVDQFSDESLEVSVVVLSDNDLR